MNDWDPTSEHQAGLLCNEGFMKERYDDKLNDLVRTFTPRGIDVVKEILKDPEYQKVFMQILSDETQDLSKETQRGVVEELKEMLK